MTSSSITAFAFLLFKNPLMLERLGHAIISIGLTVIYENLFCAASSEISTTLINTAKFSAIV